MKFFTLRKKFKRVGPQTAKHSDGYSVGSKGKEHYFYKEKNLNVLVGTELTFGASPLYINDFKSCDDEGKEIILTKEHKHVIISRIIEGLKCLDIESEIVDNSEPMYPNNLNITSMRRDPITGAWIKIDVDASGNKPKIDNSDPFNLKKGK